MSDPTIQFVGQKLDEITAKLDSMTESIKALINAIVKTNEGLGDNVKKLTETIERYTDTMTERSRDDFEHSRELLTDVSREITILRQSTGADQVIRVNQALSEMLSLLQGAINPDMIQQQLAEITQFIKSYGGSK